MGSAAGPCSLLPLQRPAHNPLLSSPFLPGLQLAPPAAPPVFQPLANPPSLPGLLLRELGREAADVLTAHASQVAPPAFMAQVRALG